MCGKVVCRVVCYTQGTMADEQPRTVLDDLDVLERYEQELAKAEAVAQAAYRKVESLRGIVENLRTYLGIPNPRFGARQASPAEVAQIKANQLAIVEQQNVQRARERRPVPQPIALPGEAPTPRGREAVREILIKTRRTMHVNEIVAEAESRGWMKDVKDPWNALSAAAKRLVKDGEVESQGRAQYRYRLDKLPPADDLVPTSRTEVSGTG
jgi:hypothetical protein